MNGASRSRRDEGMDSPSKMKNAIYRFLSFSMACQPSKMVAHPCATEPPINQNSPNQETNEYYGSTDS